MGICWSKQIKSKSHCQTITGPCPKNVSGDGGDTSNSGSNVSSSWMPQTPRDESDILQSSNLKSFTFSELKAITRDFRPDSVLGRGGFGSVYKGWVDERSFVASKRGTGMAVAVKRLNQEGRQGHKEWLAEITYLGELHHPNLVKLIGYCLEDEHRLLVYEFMTRGSLENHLFRRGSFFTPLSWSIRMKVALGAARGLAFLHRAETKVIYRDFKSSNILLDVNYDAKLSDFGLARDGPSDNETHVSTRVMGTYGYAAPEYVSTGHLTTKSDVFSFGVVLLEIISGKRSVDKNRPAGEQNLVEWARPYLASRFRVLRVLDPRLEYQYSLSQAHKLANLALQCLCMDPKRRSTMQEVVTVLEKLQDSKEDHTMQQRHSQTTSVPKSPRSSGEAVKVRPYPRPSASIQAVTNASTGVSLYMASGTFTASQSSGNASLIL